MSDLIVWVSAPDDDSIDLLCCAYDFFVSTPEPFDDELIS